MSKNQLLALSVCASSATPNAGTGSTYLQVFRLSNEFFVQYIRASLILKLTFIKKYFFDKFSFIKKRKHK